MDALVARLRARLLTSAGDAEASASVLVGVRQRLSAAMDVAQAGGRGDEQALLREQLAQVCWTGALKMAFALGARAVSNAHKQSCSALLVLCVCTSQ